MKTKKSLVLVVIMFVMSVFMMQSAYAEPGIMPLWSDIATTSHGLNITDGYCEDACNCFGGLQG